jgi:hypothetical protein
LQSDPKQPTIDRIRQVKPACAVKAKGLRRAERERQQRCIEELVKLGV